MRALHLLGLTGADGTLPPFRALSDAPLVLPAFIDREEQQQLIAFYHRAVAPDRVLPRFEVDWRTTMHTAGRRFSRYIRAQGGATAAVLVVNVLEPGQNYAQIASHPDIAAFRYVVFRCAHPLEGDTLRELRELASYTRELCLEHYESLAEGLALQEDGWRIVDPLAETFINPARMVELVNVLVDTQLRPRIDPAQRREHIYLRILNGRLRQMSAPMLVLVLGHITGRVTDAVDLLGDAATEQRHRLEDALLLRDGALVGWAAFFGEVRHRLAQYEATPAQRVEEWAKAVRTALRWLGGHVSDAAILESIYNAQRLAVEGRTEEARESLEKASLLSVMPESPEASGHLHEALGIIAWSEGDYQAGIKQLRQAIERFEESGGSTASQLVAKHNLARCHIDAGQWSQAEPLLKEVLALQMELHAPPRFRAGALGLLGQAYRKGNQVAKAEAILREALSLQFEDTSFISRNDLLLDLADLLRSAKRWAEAEPLFLEILHRNIERGDTGMNLATAQYQYAMCLGRLDRIDEAEPYWREAIALAEAEGADELDLMLLGFSRQLLNDGQWAKAEPLFERGLALAIQGGRGDLNITLSAFANELKRQGLDADAQAVRARADEYLRAVHPND